MFDGESPCVYLIVDCFDDLNFFFEQIVHQIGEGHPLALGIRGKIISHLLV